MAKNKNKLGDIFKNARENNQLSIAQFAQMVNLSDRYIQKIENEGSMPRYDNLKKVICTLSIDANSLYYDDYPEDEYLKNEIVLKLNQLSQHELKVINAAITAMINK